MSVLDAKSCGAETVSELVTLPHTTLPVDTPPLVAVKVQSRLSQSSGPWRGVHVCTACKNSFFARFCTVCPRQPPLI